MRGALKIIIIYYFIFFFLKKKTIKKIRFIFLCLFLFSLLRFYLSTARNPTLATETAKPNTKSSRLHAPNASSLPPWPHKPTSYNQPKLLSRPNSRPLCPLTRSVLPTSLRSLPSLSITPSLLLRNFLKLTLSYCLSLILCLSLNLPNSCSVYVCKDSNGFDLASCFAMTVGALDLDLILFGALIWLIGYVV
jgi:hypothetical protein